MIVGVPTQLSTAVTPVVVAAGTFDAQVTVIGPGHVIVGTTLSLTVITCAQVAVFEQRSVAR